MTTPVDFTVQVAQFAAKAKGNLHEFCTEFVQDMAEAVVRATPVDTGFLRGSWWASLDQPTAGAGSQDKSGASAVARMNLVAVGFGPGHIYYMLNGAKYAPFVEYGTSRMSPRSFVRGTVSRAAIIAEQTAARIAAR